MGTCDERQEKCAMQTAASQIVGLGEELVTFQVAMVGSDGILLASDEKVTKLSPDSKARSSFASEKIIVESDLCYCCTGNNLTMEIARHVAGIIGAEKDRQRSKEWLNNRLHEAVAIQTNKLGGGGLALSGDIFLAYRSSKDKCDLWQMSVEPSTLGFLWRIFDKGTQGDNANTARFFLEQYYPKLPVSTVQLLPLAAHCVLMAGQMNPTFVGGLEMAICTHEECRKLTKEELHPLMGSASELDHQIRSILVREKKK
jgi:hypothetical protein